MDAYQGNGSRLSGYDQRSVPFYSLYIAQSAYFNPIVCRNIPRESGPSPLYRPPSANLRGMGHQRSETTGTAGAYDDLYDDVDRDDDSGKGGLGTASYRRARAGYVIS